MQEVELKAVVDDLARCREAIVRAGARLVYEGRLEDRRYDTAGRALRARDHILRTRVYRDGTPRAELDWKGPTRIEEGYKVREELAVPVGDTTHLAAVLGHLGYDVTIAIDREIAQYELDGTTVRFEQYPRMDVLVEVEGTPEGIERAIAALGIPREAFSSDRLPDFVARYEARTGARAALCHGAFAGRIDFDATNA